MARYDILFFDVDGTLVGPDHASLSPLNREALLAARDAGALLAFATGRCRCILPESVLALEMDYAVTSNGTAIYDLRAGKRLYHAPFDPGLARIACEAARRNTDFYEIFADGEILLTADCRSLLPGRPVPPWHKRYFDRGRFPTAERLEDYLEAGTPGMEKLNLVECDPADIARLDAELRPLGLFSLSSSLGKGFEAVPLGCSKGAGIRWLCKRLGIDIRRSLAFGDGGNDVEMLRTAGCGVAMGNAAEAVRAAADRVATPYDQDGVGRFILENVL